MHKFLDDECDRFFKGGESPLDVLDLTVQSIPLGFRLRCAESKNGSLLP